MLAFVITVVAILLVYRLYSVLPNRERKPSGRLNGRTTYSVAVFLGSGGHTTEALTLLSALDSERYNRRTYVVSDGDHLSVRKALDLEVQLTGTQEHNCSILSIPRARRVGQSFFTTPFSAAVSLLYSAHHLTLRPLLRPKTGTFADLLILNGPGTCFVLCIAIYINKFLGLPAPSIIYIETFTRVKSLSLSGKLIRPFVDRFITQWPVLPSTVAQPSSDNWLV